MDISSDLLKKLSQVGYMACMKGYTREGEMIMEGVKGVRPKQTPVLMGVAIARITAMRYQDAVDILQTDILSQDPDNLTAKCFLGIALFELGDKQQSDHYFSEVMEKGDASHQAIANSYCQQ
jgi:Flp pilus assembly protein TadD